jgi:hypothetical protein
VQFEGKDSRFNAQRELNFGRPPANPNSSAYLSGSAHQRLSPNIVSEILSSRELITFLVWFDLLWSKRPIGRLNRPGQ